MEVLDMLWRWFKQKVYKFVAFLVFDELGCLHAGCLDESMGTVKVVHKWGDNDVNTVDTDIGGDI